MRDVLVRPRTIAESRQQPQLILDFDYVRSWRIEQEVAQGPGESLDNKKETLE
jgi:hypothetical protein